MRGIELKPIALTGLVLFAVAELFVPIPDQARQLEDFWDSVAEVSEPEREVGKIGAVPL